MKKIAAYIFPLFLLVSCDRARDQKGYEYFPDMAYSLAYETYAPVKQGSDSASNLSPVAHSVPTDAIPYPYEATPEGRMQAALELVCPLEPTVDNLTRGKEQFKLYCTNCHGDNGQGNGFLFTSGKYSMQPASLVNERMKAAPVGEIYHVATMGWNTMGAHGPLLSQEDRWCITLYIKNILQTE